MYCVSLLYFIIVRLLHKLKTLRLLMLAQRSYYFAVHTHKIPIFARSSDVHYLIITNFSIQKSLILVLAKLCLQHLLVVWVLSVCDCYSVTVTATVTTTTTSTTAFLIAVTLRFVAVRLSGVLTV